MNRPSGRSASVDSRRSAAASRALVRRLSTLVTHTKTMFDAMEFGFLFDPTRKLFSIGYSLTEGRMDSGYYDLLASEARLASFIAIALKWPCTASSVLCASCR